MTDTITIELPREVAEAHGFGVTTREQRLEVDSACRTALTNPTRSDESELRGSVTIEEKEDGDWLRFSPPEGASAMVLLDGIGGPIIQRSIRATAAALSQTVEDPPPTAPEESEPASESVDSSRGGDGPYKFMDEDGGAVHNAIRFTETALLKADDELRNGGTHRDAFAILNAAMNQLRTRLIAAAQNEAKVAATPEAIPLTGPVEILIRPLSEGESNG